MPDSSFTQGAPLPDITQTTTKATEAPQYYTDYLGGLAQAGQEAMYKPGTYDATTGTGTLKTGEDLIAAYDPLQTKGYGDIETAADAYKTGLIDAESTAKLATGVSASDIQNFMNPYTANVVNEMGRLSQQNVQRNLLPGLKAGFVGSGDLGSSRYAGALGQSMADIQRNLTGQQYGALSEGYKTALDAALKEQQTQIAAAKEQADLAAQAQTLGLAGAGALTKAGAEKQAYEQAKIEAPLKTASNVAKLMAGQQVPLSTTEKFVGPKAGLYQTSPLANVLSVGSVLAAAKEGTSLNKIIEGIGDGLRNYFKTDAFGNIVIDGPTVAPDEFGTDGEAP